MDKDTKTAQIQTATGPKDFKVVSSEEWLKARQELLVKEKEFTRLRDELSKQRRELPWEKIEKEYVFEGPKGKETLSDLFDGKSQLVFYHLMFNKDEEKPCKACCFWADNLNGLDLTFTSNTATQPYLQHHVDHMKN